MPRRLEHEIPIMIEDPSSAPSDIVASGACVLGPIHIFEYACTCVCVFFQTIGCIYIYICCMYTYIYIHTLNINYKFTSADVYVIIKTWVVGTVSPSAPAWHGLVTRRIRDAVLRQGPGIRRLAPPGQRIPPEGLASLTVYVELVYYSVL